MKVRITTLHFLLVLSFMCFSVLLQGCAPKIARPDQVVPLCKEMSDNSGEFMSPYTSDGVIAEWVDKGKNAKLGASIGSAIGAFAGQKLLENVPFIGGFLGEAAGNAIGRKIAIESAGGEEFIKSSSDISYLTIDDLSLCLYGKHSEKQNYQDTLSLTMEIYPKLKKEYLRSIVNASEKVL
jgi:hypothetical protein